MADDPVPIEKVKEAYLKGKAKHYPFLSRLEEPADKEFKAVITAHGVTHNVSYRKLRHGEVSYLQRLPFFYKMLADPPEPLTDAEKMQYDSLVEELVDMAVLSKSKPLWEKMSSDREIVAKLWSVIAYSSGIDPTFRDSLEDFLLDDLGFAYGAVWAGFLHKTPSEVALLPESDVIFINNWYNKWAERQKK